MRSRSPEEYTMNKILQAVICGLHLCASLSQLNAARLKVYNMHVNVLNCRTYPRSDCGHGRDYCSLIPYQSFFTTNSVIFDLPDQEMDYFYWQGIVGPCYKIPVNLKKEEYATLELYADGGYKFKNQLIQYAQEV